MSENTADQDEDFGPSATPGYKITEKKSIQEYQNLDANDESLKRWKESLGLTSSVPGPADDPRRVVILELALEVAGRPDVVLDLSNTTNLEEIKKKPFVIKEGVEYRMKVKFKIQHEVITGLKYLQVVKRKGIRDKMEEMIGSYGPSDQPYEKKFPLEEAPSGILYRGHYTAKSKFVDDDGKVHVQWSWSFDIKKDWS
ncbi:5931_t:CDS:2 [Paraglomus brasilianum]|uniref:Rho GDP-dissociation inhibitor n=1 Tax=Paraglomus brasilianum TaxID=144538 RepID=A0A9N9F994_9GLOM|nr:5931_t:CDS:2 [Paraglomus brasilianum]